MLYKAFAAITLIAAPIIVLVAQSVAPAPQVQPTAAPLPAVAPMAQTPWSRRPRRSPHLPLLSRTLPPLASPCPMPASPSLRPAAVFRAFPRPPKAQPRGRRRNDLRHRTVLIA